MNANTPKRPLEFAVLGIEEEELALLLHETLRYRSCGRFDRLPCRERAEINPENWCPWCRLTEAWMVVHA